MATKWVDGTSYQEGNGMGLTPNFQRQFMNKRQKSVSWIFNITLFETFRLNTFGLDKHIKPCHQKRAKWGFPALYADAELVSHSEFRFLKQPYVQQLKPNSFMVSFESSTPCHGAIELKSPSNRQTQVHSGQKQASFQHILVEGLSDNTPVSYRVRCMTDEDVPLYSDWYSVTTASTEAEDFFLYFIW